MAYDRLPPSSWDRLETVRAQVAGAARSAARAGVEGALDPIWSDRIERALGAALSLCDRARAAGAVIPVRPDPPGASVQVHGTVPLLPTEAAHARDWSGL